MKPKKRLGVLRLPTVHKGPSRPPSSTEGRGRFFQELWLEISEADSCRRCSANPPAKTGSPTVPPQLSR